MIQKPPALKSGDLVGVLAPAAAVDGFTLTAGVRALENEGLRVKVFPATQKRWGYLAGSDAERLDDLHAAFADPEVAAVMTARGGYGAGRLLPDIDFDLIAQNPKIFVGHSDITFLLNSIAQRSGVVTFHGPMIAGLHQQPAALAPLLRLLRGERTEWQYTAQDIIQPGTGEGILLGGCLSILASMLGTPHACDTRDALLFIEDVNEKPFRIDRMLTHLKQSRAFERVAGVIFGEMDGCMAARNEAVSVRDVIADAFHDAPFPVVYGVPSGHGTGTASLPFGVRARLAGERVTLLESPVEEYPAAS